MLCSVQGGQDAVCYSSQIQAIRIQKGNNQRTDFIYMWLSVKGVTNSAEAHLDSVVTCCSGGDGCDVEQAWQSVPCSCVDHHPGYSGWVAITRPAHISTIQGNNPINNPAYTKIPLQSRLCVGLICIWSLPSCLPPDGLLQKVRSVRYDHGEGPAQTPGVLWSLDPRRSLSCSCSKELESLSHSQTNKETC